MITLFQIFPLGHWTSTICVSGCCLFVCLNPINAEKAELIGPKFCCKKLYPKPFDFSDILKMREKTFKKPRTFFCFCFASY